MYDYLPINWYIKFHCTGYTKFATFGSVLIIFILIFYVFTPSYDLSSAFRYAWCMNWRQLHTMNLTHRVPRQQQWRHTYYNCLHLQASSHFAFRCDVQEVLCGYKTSLFVNFYDDYNTAMTDVRSLANCAKAHYI